MRRWRHGALAAIRFSGVGLSGVGFSGVGFSSVGRTCFRIGSAAQPRQPNAKCSGTFAASIEATGVLNWF